MSLTQVIYEQRQRLMSDNTFEIQYSIRVLQETLGEREGGRAFLIPKYLII